jgi:hypothetical protein
MIERNTEWKRALATTEERFSNRQYRLFGADPLTRVGCERQQDEGVVENSMRTYIHHIQLVLGGWGELPSKTNASNLAPSIEDGVN